MVHCRAPFFVNFFSHLVLCLSMSYLLWWWALYNSSPDASIEITLPHPSSNFPKWTLGVFLPHTCASALTFLTHTHLASALGSHQATSHHCHTPSLVYVAFMSCVDQYHPPWNKPLPCDHHDLLIPHPHQNEILEVVTDEVLRHFSDFFSCW